MAAKKDKDKKKEDEKVDDESLPESICDWRGSCGRKAFAEVYPIDSKASMLGDFPVFKHEGWSFLCFKHFVYATLIGNSFVWCEINVEDSTRFTRFVIKVLGYIVKFYGGIRKVRYYAELIDKLDNADIDNNIAKRLSEMVIMK